MLVLAALLALAVDDDDAFGGAPPEPEEQLADDVCTIKGDDGVWRSCSDALAAKKAGTATAESEPVDPEKEAMRARMKAADEALAKPEPPPKTKLEIELEKARLDPTMPLLALRVAVARVQEEIERLEKKGTGGRAKDEAELRLVEVTRTLDAVERIAIHRMDVCSQRRGNKPIVRNFRMTAAGAVMLSTGELMRALPLVDPAGCERILLIDDKLVARVKRREEIMRTLATTTFGYHDVDKRRALEKELASVEKELSKEAVAALSAPGVKDPYGGR